MTCFCTVVQLRCSCNLAVLMATVGNKVFGDAVLHMEGHLTLFSRAVSQYLVVVGCNPTKWDPDEP